MKVLTQNDNEITTTSVVTKTLLIITVSVTSNHDDGDNNTMNMFDGTRAAGTIHQKDPVQTGFFVEQ